MMDDTELRLVQLEEEMKRLEKRIERRMEELEVRLARRLKELEEE